MVGMHFPAGVDREGCWAAGPGPVAGDCRVRAFEDEVKEGMRVIVVRDAPRVTVEWKKLVGRPRSRLSQVCRARCPRRNGERSSSRRQEDGKANLHGLPKVRMRSGNPWRELPT